MIKTNKVYYLIDSSNKYFDIFYDVKLKDIYDNLNMQNIQMPNKILIQTKIKLFNNITIIKDKYITKLFDLDFTKYHIKKLQNQFKKDLQNEYANLNNNIF